MLTRMSPPAEAAVARALEEITRLGPAELDARIDTELGAPLLAAFSLLAGKLRPNDPPSERARSVHLMVTAALIARASDGAEGR
jgi:hypothetical protein